MKKTLCEPALIEYAVRKSEEPSSLIRSLLKSYAPEDVVTAWLSTSLCCTTLLADALVDEIGIGLAAALLYRKHYARCPAKDGVTSAEFALDALHDQLGASFLEALEEDTGDWLDEEDRAVLTQVYGRVRASYRVPRKKTDEEACEEYDRLCQERMTMHLRN